MSYAFLFLIFGLVPIINGGTRIVKVGQYARMTWCKYLALDTCQGIQFNGAARNELYDCSNQKILTTLDAESKTISLSLTNVSIHDAGNYSCMG